MVEDNFVKEAFEEISEDEQSKILANARVLSALKGKSASIGTVKIGDEVVKFRLSVSKSLRKKMALYKTRASNSEPDMEDLNNLLYDLLSALCVEEPWNQWKTWSVYDDKADIGAMEVLLEMMKQVFGHMEDVKDFRRGRGRITPVEDLSVPVRPSTSGPQPY